MFLKKSQVESQVTDNKERKNVSATYGKKNETILKILTLQNFLATRIFWKTVKPVFSNKCVNRQSITLVKDDRMFS